MTLRYLLSLLLLLGSFLPGRAQFLFQKSIGTDGLERGSQMIACRAGGYFLCGSRNEMPYLVRVDEQGDTLWTRTYSQVYTRSLFNVQVNIASIAENRAGHVMLACMGSRLVRGRYEGGGVLVLVNGTDGRVIWSQELQSPYTDYYRSVCTSNDGWSFVVNSRLLGQCCVQKIDTTGAALWTAFPLGADTVDVEISTLLAVPGGYVVGGYRLLPTFDLPLVFINEQGQEVWRKNTAPFSFPKATRGEGGSLLLTNGALTKYNSQGDTLWSRLYNVRQNLLGVISVALMPDSNYVALARRTFGPQSDWVFLKIAQDGRIIRDTILYRPSGTEVPCTALVDAQGNYVFYGWTTSGTVPPGGTSDLILAKYRGWRQTLATPEDEPATANWPVYPNPTRDRVFVSGLPAEVRGTFVVRDVLGREIMRQVQAADAPPSCSLAGLLPGLYLLTYAPHNGTMPRTWRVVKQD